MKIMTQIKEVSWEKSAVAIGKFEGLHMGHQQLIKRITKKQRADFMSVAFTFDKSPRAYFGNREGMLFTREERRAVFEEWGIDCLVECPFDEKMASMEAEAFVEEILCKKLHAGYLVVGEDFCFGKGRKGDITLLRKYERQGFFALEIVEKQLEEGMPVSSTRIRKALADGNMTMVSRMLGFPYFLEGKVVEGNKLGRTWSIPTANIMVNHRKLLPPDGVYFSKIEIDHKSYCAITNIGRKPTISDKGEKNAENYIYDFSENIYGKNIKIQLLQFYRPEQKFQSVDRLISRLQQDLQCGEKFFSEN